MGGLLGGLKPWLLGGVMAAAAGAILYVGYLQDGLDHAREQQATTQAALDITTATLAVQVERNELLVQALDKRERELNDGAQRIDQLRAQANALGADDAISDNRQWSNQRVPSSVSQWVRILTTPGDAASNAPSPAGVSD